MYEDNNYLIHYRTPGSKNGVRKYQNDDGTLTEAGKFRYLKYKGKGRPKTVKEEYKEVNNNFAKKVLTNWPGKVGTLARAIDNGVSTSKHYWDNLPSSQSKPIPLAAKAIKKGYQIGKPIKQEVDKFNYTTERKVNQQISNIDKTLKDPNNIIGAFVNETFPDLISDQNKVNEGADYLYKINDYLNTPLLAIYDGSKYLWKKSGEGAEEYNSHVKERKNPANLMLFGSGRPRVREKK